MIRSAFLLLTLAGSTLLLTPGDVSAQRRGGYRGGGYYGGNNWGVVVSPGYGVSGYYSSGSPYYGYGYRPYSYGGYYGGYSYSPYSYSQSGYYSPSYNYSAPAYSTSGYTVVPQTSNGISPASYSTSESSQNVAHLNVMLPAADAEVWLGNSQTTQQGMQRLFQSPALEPGKDYTYTVKARWTSDGKAVEQTRDVNVRAGQTSNVDFRGPKAELIPPPDRNK